MTIHLSAQLLRSTVHIHWQGKKDLKKNLDMNIDTFFLAETYFQIPTEVVNY